MSFVQVIEIFFFFNCLLKDTPQFEYAATFQSYFMNIWTYVEAIIKFYLRIFLSYFVLIKSFDRLLNIFDLVWPKLCNWLIISPLKIGSTGTIKLSVKVTQYAQKHNTITSSFMSLAHLVFFYKWLWIRAGI